MKATSSSTAPAGGAAGAGAAAGAGVATATTGAAPEAGVLGALDALAAAAVCTALEIPIEVIASGLSTADLASKWRMQVSDVEDLLIINDSYNANPESMNAALDSLVLFTQELIQMVIY